MPARFTSSRPLRPVVDEFENTQRSAGTAADDSRVPSGGAMARSAGKEDSAARRSDVYTVTSFGESAGWPRRVALTTPASLGDAHFRPECGHAPLRRGRPGRIMERGGTRTIAFPPRA